MATIHKDGRKIAASAIASSSAGNAIIRSVRRMIAAPSQPRDEARDDAQQRAEQHGGPIGDHPDQQRGARAVDQPREQVATEQVGAEPELRHSAAAAHPSSDNPSKNCSSGG